MNDVVMDAETRGLLEAAEKLEEHVNKSLDGVEIPFNVIRRLHELFAAAHTLRAFLARTATP